MKYTHHLAGISLAVLLSACSVQSQTSMGGPSASPAIEADASMTVSTPTPTPTVTPQSTPQGKQDVMMGIKQRAELSKVASFLISADLEATLKGAGPFTIFAPSNQGISHTDQSLLSSLLKVENKAELTNTLDRHIVPGTYYATDLYDGQKLKTLQGEELAITKKGNAVYVNGKLITAVDINASNGVVHVLDGVITE